MKDSSSVREDTRERVEAAIKALNYRPTLIARAMRTGRTNMILAVTPEVQDSKVNTIINLLQSIASRKGFTLILVTEETLRHLYSSESKSAISAYPVDGILFCYPLDPDITKRFAEEFNGIPKVLIGWPIWNDVSTYLWDPGEAAYIATRHLIDIGHSRIGFIGISPRNEWFKTHFNKEREFRRAFADAGMPIYENLIYAPSASGNPHQTNYKTGIDGMRFLLHQNVSPTAIVCDSSENALGCVNYLLAKGIRIPEDIAVASVEDSIACSQIVPPITAVVSPVMEASEMAMNKLLDIINNTDDGTICQILPINAPSRLYIRHSTDPNKPLVIEEQAEQGIINNDSYKLIFETRLKDA